MKIELLSIGTEILLGDILNSNSQFLAKELSELGFDVFHQSVIGDNEERIMESFRLGFSRSDIIITTGGLGPTPDDLTKSMVSKFFNRKMIPDEDSLNHIEFLLNKKGEKLTGGNISQAYFPEGSTILPNPHGTANGMILQDGDNAIILLPGPPNELKPMFFDYVIPHLSNLSDSILVSKVLRLFGIGEGVIAENISDLINKGTNPTIAPYAKDSDVILRITAKAKNEEEANNLLAPVEKQIRQRLNDYIYAEGNTSVEELICNLLLTNGLTISINESITGGLLTSTLLDHAYSGIFFKSSITFPVVNNKYEILNDSAKAILLKLNDEILEKTHSNITISTIGSIKYIDNSSNVASMNFLSCININGSIEMFEFTLQGNVPKIKKRATTTILHKLRKSLIRVCSANSTF